MIRILKNPERILNTIGKNSTTKIKVLKLVISVVDIKPGTPWKFVQGEGV